MGNIKSNPSNEVSSVSHAVNNGPSSFTSTYTNVNGEENFHGMTGQGGAGAFSHLFSTGVAAVGTSLVLLLLLTFWAHRRYTSKIKSRSDQESVSGSQKERAQMSKEHELSDFSWESANLSEVSLTSD